MSKAFTKEDSDVEELLEPAAEAIPAGKPNYITPAGFKRLEDELRFLIKQERPKIVDIVSWAAGNGDRSENGDYIYGKRRLREIDSRIRFLTKRIESAKIVDPALQTNREQVFFGATVTYAKSDDSEATITIAGADESDLDAGLVSWLSPVAQALLRSRVGDVVEVRSPGGREELEIVSIRYGGQQ
jgi:transcription elongation factor GreB